MMFSLPEMTHNYSYLTYLGTWRKLTDLGKSWDCQVYWGSFINKYFFRNWEKTPEFFS